MRIFAGFVLIVLCLTFVFGSASASPPKQQGACPGFEARLALRQLARVTPGLPNNLRRSPSIQAEKIGSIPAEAVFRVLGGPRCQDGLTWWRVNYNGVIGWTAEGQGNDHWLELVHTGSDSISSGVQNGSGNVVSGVQDGSGNVVSGGQNGSGNVISGGQGNSGNSISDSQNGSGNVVAGVQDGSGSEISGGQGVVGGGTNGNQGVVSSDDLDDGSLSSDNVVPIRQNSRPAALGNVSIQGDMLHDPVYSCYNGDAASDFRISSGITAFDVYGEIANGATVELTDHQDFIFWTSQMPGICSADPLDLGMVVAIAPSGREVRPFIYERNGMISIHLPLVAYSRPGLWQLRANSFQININVPRLNQPAFLVGSYPTDQGRVWIGGFQPSERVVIADLNAGYREYMIQTNANGYFVGQLQVTGGGALIPTAFVSESGNVLLSDPLASSDGGSANQLLYDTYFGP